MSNELENGEKYLNADQPHPVEEAPKVEAAPAEPEKKHSSQQEQNWRAMRDRADAAERRAAELERMISYQEPRQKIQLVEDEDDDMDIADDSLLEGKPFKKYIKGVKKDLKETKKQLREQQEHYSLSLAEFKLKAEYNDFDQVVSKENLEKLAYQKPILYKTMMASQDMYEKGSAAYDLIKSAGIVQDRSAFQEQDRRLEENKSKPRAAAIASPQTSDTPLQRVGDYDRRILTEERKDQLRRQVEEAKRLR